MMTPPLDVAVDDIRMQQHPAMLIIIKLMESLDNTTVTMT